METTSGGNPVGALLGFWMLLQLVLVIGLLLGGIYVLYCLGRAASGLDRLASAVEALVLDKIKSDTPPPASPSPGSFAIPPLTPPTSPFQPGAPVEPSYAGEPRPTNPTEIGPPDSATVSSGPGGTGDTQPRL